MAPIARLRRRLEATFVQDQMMALSRSEHQVTAAWAYETDAIAALLRAAEREILRDAADIAVLWPFLATASSAVEKMLKLATLSSAVEQSIKFEKHEVVDLDSAIWSRSDPKQIAPLARPAVEAQNANDLWPLMLSMLESYAIGGRFYYLDVVNTGPKEAPSPKHRWDELQQAVAESDPDLVASRAAYADGMPGGSGYRSSLREATLCVLMTWVHAMLALGEVGALGGPAGSWFGQVRLELNRGRREPI